MGGRAAPIDAQNLANAQRDLRSAQELVPQLENQLHDLQKDYSDSGYDALDYASWTPGETRVSGRGIEQVGRAVAASGSPAGVKPTGDEFEIALVATAAIQLGRAVLRKTASNALSSPTSKCAGMSNREVSQQIGKSQRELLNQWMGRGLDGARRAVGKGLPDGLTADTLRAYQEVARRQIAAGLDKAGTQAARLKLIEEILRRIGH